MSPEWAVALSFASFLFGLLVRWHVGWNAGYKQWVKEIEKAKEHYDKADAAFDRARRHWEHAERVLRSVPPKVGCYMAPHTEPRPDRTL